MLKREIEPFYLSFDCLQELVYTRLDMEENVLFRFPALAREF